MVDDGELVAVVTSRHMYIALATRNELLADGNHNLRMRDIR